MVLNVVLAGDFDGVRRP
ncbi:hypothetical protein P9501_00555 [Escherichia coli]